ncbi:hypothetical protein BTHERMOSOX_1309 [Bathymodiolus thermophilus thioautotrophic gill symbiont]|uniref:Uncharacterized protein n=1 Tax=Bathymodiolus thermophilus thioautotrophic gill symbiont TaxID=2360 RepID=A0A3G3ILR9_9GAMM|nr:hypothetical protein [Bathymodiolus thermophilus thioautotrophic gill symbiont]AYQ56679.1 hypothetical protein MS2017_0960 [Bathymodiolus thermophilus thioautotrophic gill symbiont]CAB5503055.1 hypothetical protein THERMOS_1719 [Bathymodiolus thermophilus thioautotrophic gill symbiont]SHA23544.1 hypothetical protein BTHERMOSOX_1309 [Bathymodiolus thermophilus thioautotrophic gill symbiont]
MTTTNRFIALFFLFTLCVPALATLNPNPVTKELHISDPAINTPIVTTMQAVDMRIKTVFDNHETTCALSASGESHGEFTQTIIYCDPSIHESGLVSGDYIDVGLLPLFDGYTLCINGNCNYPSKDKSKVKNKAKDKDKVKAK